MVEQLFDNASRKRTVEYPSNVEVPGVFNPHVHPRDTQIENDGRAEMLIPVFSDGYEEVVGIGNTKTPITTTALAQAKLQQWRSLVPQGSTLRMHMAGLVTETTEVQDVLYGYDQPDETQCWIAMKMFLRSVSNAHGADVDDITRVVPLLKAMTHTRWRYRTRGPMPLMIHAERKFDLFGRRVSIYKREAAAIERDIPYLLEQVPKAKIIICHVSDKITLDVIRHLRSKGFNIRGEICPHYTRYTADDLFEGPGGGTALNTHLFCLPVFKTEEDRQAIMEAMLSGEDFWHYATDEACHWDDPTQIGGVKTNSLGYTLGGQTQIPEAVLSYVIEQFVKAGKEALLAGFLSHNGRTAYGLPKSSTVTMFRKQDWKVPSTLKHGGKEARVAMGGEMRKYKLNHLKMLF